MRWVPARTLAAIPLTGLARKILRKMDVMQVLRARRIARDARLRNGRRK
jgi:hypothetical protein